MRREDNRGTLDVKLIMLIPDLIEEGENKTNS